MEKRIFGVIFGIILVSCMISPALSAPEVVREIINSKDISLDAGACDQPYALCDTAMCVPSQTDPSVAICSCYNVDGASLTMDSCSDLAPVGMYINDYGQWMIKAGYPVGQITSTYSFYQAAPVEGREIDPDNTSEFYTGDIYLKPCKNGDWADCFQKPCQVLPKDPLADVNYDRPASDYAVCECGMVYNSTEWFMAVHGDEACDSDTICNDFIWSAADSSTMDQGIAILKKYLMENPEADPAQQYAMGYCSNCSTCTGSSV